MKKYDLFSIILLSIVILCSSVLNGQNQAGSSTTNIDTNTVIDPYLISRDSARWYHGLPNKRDIEINYIKERKFLQIALQIAKANNEIDRIASTQMELGVNYLNVASYDSSHIYFDNAKSSYTTIGDTLQLLLIDEYVANLYQQQNKIQEALATYYTLILKYEALKTFEGIYNSRVLRYNTAYILILQKDYDRALEYLKPCFEDISYLNPTKEQLDQMEELSVNYNLQIAQVYDALSLRDTARVYYEKTLEISKKIAWPYTEADAYLGLGKYEVDVTQNFRKANQYATDAYKLFQAIEGEKPGLISSLNLLSHINWHIGKYADAKKYAEQAVLIAEEIDQYEGIREGHQNLSKISQNQGDYKHALEHYIAAVSANDSIFSLARDKTLQDLSAKYEDDIDSLKIANLETTQLETERRNQLTLLLYIIGALGLIALGYYILTKQKLRQAKKAADYEKTVSNALNKFVPRSFLKTLGYDNILEVKLGDQIEQEVSIVFTDIRSFTTISENLTPSDNFKFVKSYAEKMGPIIVKNGGFINQYLGDGIMAIFQGSPNDALNACIEMQEAVHEYNQDIEQLPNGNPIAVGMGIHTGPLVMGIIGDETRQDAAIISDTVNTAARLEGLTKPYGTPILLSEVSYNKLENPEKYTFRYLGVSKVKGKADAIKIYECINGRISPDQAKIIHSILDFEEAVRSFEKQMYTISQRKFEGLHEACDTDKAVVLYLEKIQNNETV